MSSETPLTLFRRSLYISIRTGTRRVPALVKKRGKPKLPINNTPPKLNGSALWLVLNLSKLTHLQNLKRSFVGVGGLEVRETTVSYFDIGVLPNDSTPFKDYCERTSLSASTVL